MVDFIRMDLLELTRAVKIAGQLQITKYEILAHNRGPSAYGADVLPLSNEDWCLSSD